VNAAARELGLISAARAKEPIYAKAQAMRVSLGLKPHPALYPPLILSLSDRVGSA
jgi:hypothetical protein